MIRSATACGCETIDKCGAAVLTTYARARSAIAACAAGGRTRSALPTKAHAGIGTHAGTPRYASESEENVKGRWLAASAATVAPEAKPSPAKSGPNSAGLIYTSASTTSPDALWIGT